MSKKILLFISVLFYTGCVERGYELTVNNNTNTVTALKSVDIHKSTTITTKADIDKMNASVTEEQKKQPSINKRIKGQDKETEKNITKEIQAQKQLEEKKLLEEKKRQEQQAKEAQKALVQEKETKYLAAEKKREALKEKDRLAKEAAKEKEKEALEKKLVREKAQQKEKAEREKLALERQIEKELLEKKIAAEKKATEEKRVAQLKKEKAEKKRKQALAKEMAFPKTETITFIPSTQTYQKFGTSEIHGHVVYLTPTGQEISLKNTKIYLVPKNTKTDYWYNNYYLKNKEASSLSKTTVQYINATHLNLEKNFAFYGLATGTYYIIIESRYPASIAKNEKVYIAKKITVKKYKKIMTVFSKKL